MQSSDFLNIEFDRSTLDLYYVRTSILKSITANMKNFQPVFLDVGCGKMPYKKYILSNSPVETYHGLDIETAMEYDSGVKPDFEWNGITMPFANETYNTAMATEVLEHCPKPEIVLNEVYRVLRKDGLFFFTVPFLWPLHEVPYDEFRYTPYSLKRLLTESGFTDIEIEATGGWHASMAQMLGLWVKRAPMNEGIRKTISFFIKPVIRYLINKDQKMKINFGESQMITGLRGIAYKRA